jgi:hypothetical protein
METLRIPIFLPTQWRLWYKDIQRAEGTGDGSPRPGTEVIIAAIPGERIRWVDRGALAPFDRSKTYIYRYRRNRVGAVPGSWSNWSQEYKPTPPPRPTNRLVVEPDGKVCLFRGENGTVEDDGGGRWWAVSAEYARFYGENVAVQEVSSDDLLDLSDLGTNPDSAELPDWLPRYHRQEDGEMHRYAERDDVQEAVRERGYRGVAILQWHVQFGSADQLECCVMMVES